MRGRGAADCCVGGGAGLDGGAVVLEDDDGIGKRDIGVVMLSAAAMASRCTGGALSRTRLWPLDLP
eukprot:4114207-Lingulodinium_polyedra.AAC.1